LVVDGGSNLNSAVLDENGVKQAQRSGWKGIIVVGAIRGSKTIGSLPIGVKALGTSPRKGSATTGNKGVSLSFSGVQVVPGNWIYCDKVSRLTRACPHT
jgi:regulator of ribonuclease activity A